MIAVEADNKEIRVNIPTEGMSAEAIRAFVDWLRVEAAARRGHLTEDELLDERLVRAYPVRGRIFNFHR
jgi:hypothetical protein